jgi:anti-anti-sigma factor
MEPNYAAADAELEINKEISRDALVVHFIGGFSLVHHLRLTNTVQEIKAAPQRKVVLDLAHVTFIDSLGVGVIVSVLKHTRTNAIGFALVTNDAVDQILGVTNLLKILNAARSVEQAVAQATP